MNRAELIARLEEGATVRRKALNRDGTPLTPAEIYKAFKRLKTDEGKAIAAAMYVQGDESPALAEIYEYVSANAGPKTQPITKARIAYAILTELSLPLRCEPCEGSGWQGRKLCASCRGVGRRPRSHRWVMHACGQTNPSKFKAHTLPVYDAAYRRSALAVDCFLARLVAVLGNTRCV